MQQRRLRFELRELALVATGAIPGALLRWQVGVRFGPLLGGGASGQATAHLLVNLLGSFLLGVLAGPIPGRTLLLLLGGIGFCGSLTTFSSWMLDLVVLSQQGSPGAALLNLLLSLVLGVAAAAAGLALCRRLRRRGPLRSPS
jgi:CrcB protein